MCINAWGKLKGVGINQQKFKISVPIVNAYLTIMYYCSYDTHDMYILQFYLVEIVLCLFLFSWIQIASIPCRQTALLRVQMDILVTNVLAFVTVLNHRCVTQTLDVSKIHMVMIKIKLGKNLILFKHFTVLSELLACLFLYYYAKEIYALFY